MSWKSKVGQCDRCGKEGKLIPAFGKYICHECKSNRPNKMQGNAGMFESSQMAITFGSNLYLERVPKSNVVFGKMFFEHYPESKGIPGRSFCYLIHNNGAVAGIIGFNSPPSNYKVFREYFQVDNDNIYMSNNVFRIVESEHNLATKVMKLAREQLQRDHILKWGFPLIGLVTFVEPPRTGALYKADNWDYLGMSKGIAMKRDKETWEKVFTQDVQKLIYGYKYKMSRYHSLVKVLGGLTPHAPDVGEAATSQALSQPEVLFTQQAVSTPAPTLVM